MISEGSLKWADVISAGDKRMLTPAIVVIAYNRAEPLGRLLRSIENAYYPPGIAPELVISIDKSDSDSVTDLADAFVFTHGSKRVIKRSERMGLRNHVLSCGDLTEEYGSIIVLEDDLFAAPGFYQYACKALTFAENDDRIGTVSLYDHLFNVHKREAFCAMDDGYDNYYLQLASSWGQAYTKKQWQGFRKWYDADPDRKLDSPLIPANVRGWSERSWLKYYIAYLIETGRYSLYPRLSLTTNFGDVGTHACKSDSDLQVPLKGLTGDGDYIFSSPDQSGAVYDAFFEPIGKMVSGKICLGRLDPGGEGEDTEPVMVDLYGYRTKDELIGALTADGGGKGPRYVLTSQILPCKRIRSYARQMRPADANVVYDIEGNDIHLYDTRISDMPPAREPEAVRYLYEYRAISAARMIKILMYRIKEKLSGK